MIYAYVCVFSHGCTRMWRSEVNFRSVPLSISTFSFEIRSLTEHAACWFSEAGQLVSPRDPPVSAFPAPWIKGTCHHTQLVYVGTGSPDSGPQAFVVSPLLTKPIPWLMKLIFKNRIENGAQLRTTEEGRARWLVGQRSERPPLLIPHWTVWRVALVGRVSVCLSSRSQIIKQMLIINCKCSTDSSPWSLANSYILS